MTAHQSPEELLQINRELRRQISIMQESLRSKNLELDSMHYVWCDGGCGGGVHRWTEGRIDKELVERAERNAHRLRTWFENNRKYPDLYGYVREQAKKAMDNFISRVRWGISCREPRYTKIKELCEEAWQLSERKENP